VVRIELVPTGSGTVLVLEHTVQADRGMGAIGFWTGALSRLPARERA
jgi:hypothetical protein